MEKQQEFNMEKVFQPNQVESRIYDMWEHSGAFKPVVDPEKKPFVIVMPPPNITGQLHIGHALDEMPQDVVVEIDILKSDGHIVSPMFHDTWIEALIGMGMSQSENLNFGGIFVQACVLVLEGRRLKPKAEFQKPQNGGQEQEEDKKFLKKSIHLGGLELSVNEFRRVG